MHFNVGVAYILPNRIVDTRHGMGVLHAADASAAMFIRGAGEHDLSAEANLRAKHEPEG